MIARETSLRRRQNEVQWHSDKKFSSALNLLAPVFSVQSRFSPVARDYRAVAKPPTRLIIHIYDGLLTLPHDSVARCFSQFVISGFLAEWKWFFYSKLKERIKERYIKVTEVKINLFRSDLIGTMLKIFFNLIYVHFLISNSH